MTQILPRLVGIKKAKELSFACNFLNAQEALHFGLVNKVVPLEELHLAAEKLASDIINNNQMVVRKMKEVIDQGEGMTLEDAIRLEQLENYRYRSAARASEVTEEIEGILEKGREQAKGITG